MTDKCVSYHIKCVNLTTFYIIICSEVLHLSYSNDIVHVPPLTTNSQLDKLPSLQKMNAPWWKQIWQWKTFWMSFLKIIDRQIIFLTAWISFLNYNADGCIFNGDTYVCAYRWCPSFEGINILLQKISFLITIRININDHFWN